MIKNNTIFMIKRFFYNAVSVQSALQINTPRNKHCTQKIFFKKKNTKTTEDLKLKQNTLKPLQFLKKELKVNQFTHRMSGNIRWLKLISSHKIIKWNWMISIDFVNEFSLCMAFLTVELHSTIHTFILSGRWWLTHLPNDSLFGRIVFLEFQRTR